MKTDKLLKVLATASKLKENTRHSWLKSGRRESVAEHCWRLSLLAYFMKDEFPEADIERVIEMCLFHDMGEAFTGDIPSFIKTKNDEAVELEVVKDWVSSLPSPYCADLSALFREIEENTTAEAKLFNAIDRLEAAITHNEADIRTWIPQEYDLNPEYGREESRFSPYLSELQDEIAQISLDKIKAAKKN